ncbi:MAG: HD domain-containing protein [Desulfomonile tiedjei]|uniref:HD domain-containing protein n=1 Tax=Desulfomonile tiedjei TaxID=2358 RepID=A0A9D6V7C6_9BACT|nr:HD domain-containing protein [Desulfomonile tiedjei]
MKKPEIEANQAVEDIRSGFDDTELMKKYGLSARGLQSLFAKLVSAGVLRKSEIEARNSNATTSIIVDLVSPGEEADTAPVPFEERPRVIAISEDSELLSSVRNLLEPREISVIACADADLNLFRHIRPHLALIDLNSGKNSREDLFISLSRADEFFPVIVMVESVRQSSLNGLEEGVYDVIEKPLDQAPFVTTIRRALEYCDLVRLKRDYERPLDKTAARRNSELLMLLDQANKTQDVTILTLAKLGESRSQGSGAHLILIQKLCRILSVSASLKPAFKETLTPQFIDNLVRSCVLHDIGKAALPDTALQGEEWTDQETLKQHPVLGGRTLEEAAAKLDDENFFSVGMQMAYYHHEHWDGSGYPFGLPGNEIPLSARILALAEAYARMVSAAPDREPCSHEEACKRIQEGKGSQFDPGLVEAFLEVETEIRKIC